jgi:ABC-type sugar transport system permease subunit
MMDLKEKWVDEANWMQLTQDRAWWQAFVNTVMNLWVP